MKFSYSAKCGTCRVVFDVQGEVYSYLETLQDSHFCRHHNGSPELQNDLMQEASEQMNQMVPRYYLEYTNSVFRRQILRLYTLLSWSYVLWILVFALLLILWLELRLRG